MFPVLITGPRLTLREFRTDSMAVVGDPEVTRTLSFDPRSRDDQADRLAQDIARAHTRPRPDYYLAIANSDDVLIRRERQRWCYASPYVQEGRFA